MIAFSSFFISFSSKNNNNNNFVVSLQEASIGEGQDGGVTKPTKSMAISTRRRDLIG